MFDMLVPAAALQVAGLLRLLLLSGQTTTAASELVLPPHKLTEAPALGSNPWPLCVEKTALSFNMTEPFQK